MSNPFTRSHWSTSQLMAVMRDVEPPSDYWLSNFFPETVTFSTEYIDFEMIKSNGRPLAPFVAPMNPGHPVYKASGNVKTFKPAYVKVRDDILASQFMSRRVGNLLAERPPTPQENYLAYKAEIVSQQYDAIMRRLEWLACQAIINGSVVCEGPDFPPVTVDFQRQGNHTVTLSGGDRWGEAGVSIVDSVQTYIDRMYDTEFGGIPTRITVGAGAWKLMRDQLKANGELKDLIDTNFSAQPGVDLLRGTVSPLETVRLGTLGGNVPLEVWLYRDYYTDPAGQVVKFIHDNDVIFTAPGVGGVRAFGAIQDIAHEMQVTAIAGRNHINLSSDPASEFIIHQTAPLMVPVMPNRTLRLRVR